MTNLNFVENSGFESATTEPWRAANTSVTNRYSHSGSCAAIFPENNTSSYLAQYVPVHSTEQLEFQIYLGKIGGETSNSILLQITFHDSDYKYLGSGLFINIPADKIPNVEKESWLSICQKTTTAPHGTATAFILINELGNTGDAPILLDDISLSSTYAHEATFSSTSTTHSANKEVNHTEMEVAKASVHSKQDNMPTANELSTSNSLFTDFADNQPSITMENTINTTSSRFINLCLLNSEAETVDLIELFSAFASFWTEENRGGDYTIFTLPHSSNSIAQGIKVSSTSPTFYEDPEVILLSNLQTLDTLTFENTTNKVITDTIQFNQHTQTSESWRLLEAVSIGGDNFYNMNTPFDLNNFSDTLTESTLPGNIPFTTIFSDTAQSLDIDLNQTNSQFGRQSWNIEQPIRLLPDTITRVSLQTRLTQERSVFQFNFDMTGFLGVTTTRPVNGVTEHYFPITEIIQESVYPQIEVRPEFNGLRCTNTGEYITEYRIEPTLLIEIQSITNPFRNKEIIIPVENLGNTVISFDDFE
ncbi:hypothetical protein CAI16_16380 [Virgibacillus dokdonensis]|uniref:Uncharacterized protein n=1 Tax=Virgibacillus dokdonensis TaxID=302167 RepID=A0A3E0WLM9_9BACI|nr:NTTRR-F1 domain [Virgibacillus dokdonensis]RFA32987.1 hypothetical protein CAI16_16380 [Virgibacillus dokdonensis]